MTDQLPRAWSIHDPDALPLGHPALCSFDVLVDGVKAERVRGYDCAAGTVLVVDVDATIKAGRCVERELTGEVTLRLKTQE